MKESKLNLVIKQASRFSKYHLAKSYAERTVKPSGILLGDDGYFWALPIGKAALLNRRGYELA